MDLGRRQFLQYGSLLSAGSLFPPAFSFLSMNPVPDLPRATPESTGVLSESIIQYLTEPDKSGV